MLVQKTINASPLIWLVCLFFFFSLIFPTDFQPERLPLLCLIVLLSLFAYATGKNVHIQRSIVSWYLLCLNASLFFIGVGVYNNNPGAIPVTTVYLIWPALYMFLIGVAGGVTPYVYLIRTILCATIVSSMMGIALLSEVYLGINFGLTRFAVESGWGVGIEEGAVAYSLPNIGTVICGTSLALGLVLSGQDYNGAKICSKKLCYTALFLGMLSGILSGRQALLLSLFLAPIVYFIIIRLAGLTVEWKRSHIFIVAVVLVSVLASMLVFDVDFSLLYQSVLDGFSHSDSYIWRQVQFDALMYEWGESPLIGHGLGASSRFVIRSYEQPWAYELYYVALLFQTGIVGIAIYTSAVIWIFSKSAQLLRRLPQATPLLLPLLVCLASLLFANGTNPYLGKFDYLWVLFLPVGMLNILMTQVDRHDRHSDCELELGRPIGDVRSINRGTWR